ncbi:hypothetical protein NKH18_21930 [Streptomyces sp. M10(2022)]
MTEFEVRAVNSDDAAEIDRLYEICVRTSAAGEDGTAMFEDPVCWARSSSDPTYGMHPSSRGFSPGRTSLPPGTSSASPTRSRSSRPSNGSGGPQYEIGTTGKRSVRARRTPGPGSGSPIPTPPRPK